MFSKYLAAIFFAAMFSVFAFADGGFYGSVSYTGNNCDCVQGDKVAIQATSSEAPPSYFWIDHLHATHEYSTGSTTFPPGNYRIWVVLSDSSTCYGSDVEIVSHGSGNQEVNITVHGAEGGSQ